MRRYHINPRTGVPSVCRAENGNCPYGGESGDQNHYNTYSEAQKKSQEYFEKVYNLLPNSMYVDEKKIMEEIEEQKKMKKTSFELLPKEGDYEITKAIMETQDENVVMAVIDGEIYKDNGWTYTSAALQSPSISKKFLEEALFTYPGEFDETTRRWLVLNRSLEHDHLQAIIEDEREDMWIRAVAFRNPNVSKEYVNNIIENNPDKLDKLPYSMIYYSEHANETTDYLKDEALLLGTRNASDISAAQTMAIKYAPWNLVYRNQFAKGNN